MIYSYAYNAGWDDGYWGYWDNPYSYYSIAWHDYEIGWYDGDYDYYVRAW